MGVGSGLYMYDVVVKRWPSLSHLLMSVTVAVFRYVSSGKYRPRGYWATRSARCRP